jgi:hypothetical protein
MAMEQRSFDTDSPWTATVSPFPLDAPVSQKLRYLLNFAVLAPSSYNSQPWLFRIAGDEIELYADRTRGLPVIDPDDRELLMACGAALFNLRLAIRHFGFTPIVRTFPDLDDPDLLAFVRMGPPSESEEESERLFKAIRNRRTHRTQMEPRRLGADEVGRLSEAASAEGAVLFPITDPDVRSRIADLVAKGVEAQGGDKRYRRELGNWIHPNRSKSRDGIPGRAHGLSDLRSIAEPLLTRSIDWGPERAAQLRENVEEAPALFILATKADSSSAWLDAGQALQRVLLSGAGDGVAASYFNQPVQMAELRSAVAELLPAPKYCPQLILRMGFGGEQQSTPRRSVAEVVTMNRYL